MASASSEESVKGEKEERKEEKIVSKAMSMGFSESESRRMLKLYGGKRLFEILKKAKAEGGILGSKVMMTKVAHLAMADSMFNEMLHTQGVSWLKAVVGVKVRLRLDVLMIYNGERRGPKVKISTKSGKEVFIETQGAGMLINTSGSRRNCAMFGLLPPNGREWSEWEPCFFAGDPSDQKSYTPLKKVADGCNTTKDQWPDIESLGYRMNKKKDPKAPSGIPIGLLKKAANDTIKLAGFEGKPGWDCGIDIDEDHPEKAISSVKDDRARNLLEEFWFVDSEDCDEGRDDDEDIWS